MTLDQIIEVQARSTQLLSEAEVETALDSMAVSITTEMADKNPLMICIMHGGLITSGKLAPRLNFPLQLDYLHATRYRGETSGSDLQWKVFPSASLKDRAVLLIDDIMQTGSTMKTAEDLVNSVPGVEVAATFTIFEILNMKGTQKLNQ